MYKFDRLVIDKIKLNISLKKKKKNNLFFVDAYFVLKIILDMFRI